MTFSPGGTCSAIAALVSPIRGRRSKMSIPPDFDASQPQHLVGHQAPFLRTPAETEPMPQHPPQPSQIDG
jgi:hypothetical protein